MLLPAATDTHLHTQSYPPTLSHTHTLIMTLRLSWTLASALFMLFNSLLSYLIFFLTNAFIDFVSRCFLEELRGGVSLQEGDWAGGAVAVVWLGMRKGDGMWEDGIVCFSRKLLQFWSAHSVHPFHQVHLNTQHVFIATYQCFVLHASHIIQRPRYFSVAVCDVQRLMAQCSKAHAPHFNL